MATPQAAVAPPPLPVPPPPLPSSSSSSVRVLCRFRPLNAAELAGPSLGRMCIAQLSDESVQLATSDRAQHSYTFDRVFGTNAQQRQLFEDGARPIVQAVLQGYNGAVIAYGQTGSGKTHTMMGPPGGAGADADEAEQGLCARCVRDLFAHMQAADAEVQFELIVSFVEIYQERIRDLLDVSKDDLKLGEHGANGASVYVKDVTGLAVDSEEQVLDTMRSGAANRAVAATGMNAGSSRSHSVFTLMLKQKDTRTQTVLSGKLMLVDLAGSEQVSKAGVSGQQLEELKRINRSLSALGNVINALTDDKSTHVPYRDSKLTRLLQDCLGGNSKTALVICCSPSAYNEMESLSTLRFGRRAKNIRNRPLLNLERGPEDWRRLADALELRLGMALKREAEWLALARSGAISAGPAAAKLFAALVATSEKACGAASASVPAPSPPAAVVGASVPAAPPATPSTPARHNADATVSATPSVELVDGQWAGPYEEVAAAKDELERHNKTLVGLLREAGSELQGAKLAVDGRDARISELQERLRRAESAATVAAAHAAAAAAATPATYAVALPQPPIVQLADDEARTLRENYKRALLENEELRADTAELRETAAATAAAALAVQGGERPGTDLRRPGSTASMSSSSLVGGFEGSALSLSLQPSEQPDEQLLAQQQQQLAAQRGEIAGLRDVIAAYETRVAALTRAATVAAEAAAAAGQRAEGGAEALVDTAASLRIVVGAGEGGGFGSQAAVRIRGGAAGRLSSSHGAAALAASTATSAPVATAGSPVEDGAASAGFFRTLLKRLSTSPSKAGPSPGPTDSAAAAAVATAAGSGTASQQSGTSQEETERRAATLAAFFRACEEGDLAHVKSALAAGAVRPSSTDKSGRTGLLYAGRGGQLRVVQTLVRAGCAVGSYDKDARNALAYAARRGHVEVASWLLQQGVSPSACDVHGLTPLHQAVLGRHTGVCELLLAAGADMRCRDSNGNTALRLAMRFGTDERDDSRAVLLCLRAHMRLLPRDEQRLAGRDDASLAGSVDDEAAGGAMERA